MKTVSIMILLLDFFSMTMPIYSNDIDTWQSDIEKAITLYYKRDINWGKDERSLMFQLTATHDNASIYLYSNETMEEAIITVFDSQGNIIAYSIAYISPEQRFSLPLNAGKGKYYLEVEYKEYCYYGDFEI